MKPLLYVAGPYSGDVGLNIRNAALAAKKLRDAGFATLVPHYCLLSEVAIPELYEAYLEHDLELVAHCDGLCRLEGASSGADREVARAEELGITCLTLERWLEVGQGTLEVRRADARKEVSALAEENRRLWAALRAGADVTTGKPIADIPTPEEVREAVRAALGREFNKGWVSTSMGTSRGQLPHP